jgi:hypothetical protein
MRAITWSWAWRGPSSRLSQPRTTRYVLRPDASRGYGPVLLQRGKWPQVPAACTSPVALSTISTQKRNSACINIISTPPDSL